MLVLCFLRVISILFGKYRNYVKNKSCFVLSGFCFLFFVFMFFLFFCRQRHFRIGVLLRQCTCASAVNLRRYASRSASANVAPDFELYADTRTPQLVLNYMHQLGGSGTRPDRWRLTAS
jgi:hypothetical protein